MIVIGVVSRRKGLNSCPYIVLALFFGVFAWFCLLAQKNTGAGQKKTVMSIVSQGKKLLGTSLKKLRGNSAQNTLAPTSVPNPDGNSAPNPYAQASVPNLFGNPAPILYAEISSVPNPYGNPAPNLYT